MDLKQHYTSLYNQSIEKIAADTYQIDNQIDSLSDNRFGISLLIRPDSHTKKNIQGFLDELKQIDPELYYYPSSDIHITVLSIISCYDGFDLATISIPDYAAVIEKSLVEIKDIAINFKGITASPSAIMLQGFTNSNSLDDLRNNLRKNFTNSGLEESIDKRYSINTAHATVARFRKKISNKDKWIEILEKYRNFDFGNFKVDKYNLVYNDWYQRKQFVKELHEFQCS
ncbi:2'-5' RNA ligase family protein [Flavobacterium sp. LB3P122]|uniref:2'-5' RNA ligase family protein n=1 Tax=Flavobacterium algoriphilum TaxID=3398738 RepID=UPI003A848A50